MPSRLTLALNSPQWAQLEDAYGSAAEIPALLIELERESQEALVELFSRLCHQMSVYSSSIAAFPHLITLASKPKLSPRFQTDVISLAGAICESREYL